MRGLLRWWTLMSSRNSHAAKAARRAEREARMPAPRRPVPVDKDAVAEAVHQAVCLVSRDQGAGHCDAYAFGGAAVLSRLTGCQWWPQAGEARYGTGRDRDAAEGEICFAYQPSGQGLAITAGGTMQEGGLANGEVHVWAARAEDGMVAEVADFGARHVPALSSACGIGWAREPLDCVWGTRAELAAQRIWHIAEDAATKAIWQVYGASLDAYKDITYLALARLGVMTDRDARQKLNNPVLLDVMRDGLRVTETFPGGAFIAVRS